MAVLQRLETYLSEHNIPYTKTVHPLAFTAQEVAQAEHLSGRMIAKCVVLLADDAYVMAVLPADSVVDLQELRQAIGAAHLRLATEKEIADLFPDCELGAMPPFGNLYGLSVYVENSLAQQQTIAFNAGTHRDVVHLQFADFRRAVEPMILPFGRRVAA
ncbi:MAG: YbaK/EbsC family protein [Acidobacteria bacterium]|nr:YbaK/EbsC family protein [Acidobacteriota bacterium]